MKVRGQKRRLSGGTGLLLWLVLATPSDMTPEAPIDPVPALREARSQWDHGSLDEALATLGSLRHQALADHTAYLRARLLNETGDAEGALAALDEALEQQPPTELSARVHELAARVHLEQGDLIAAYRRQREAWQITRDQAHAAELALDLARAFEARGLPGDALGLYRTTWQRWPLQDAGRLAYERAGELTFATGAAPVPAGLHLNRADRLRDALDCVPALPIYEAVLGLESRPQAADSGAQTPQMAPGGDEAASARNRARALRGRADCLFQRRRYQEAAEAYQLVAREAPDDLDPAIRVARSQARAGHRQRAIALLDQLSRRASEEELAQIRYLMAVLWRQDQPEKSRRLLRAVERQRTSPGLARLARWRLAWEDLLAGRSEAAIKRLQPFTRGSQWDIEVQRARYWRAVALLDVDPAQGEAALRELTEQVPLSYYGLIAARRLGIRPHLERSFVGERQVTGPFPREARARWLIEGGFPELARVELESWIRERRLDRAARLAAAPLLHELGAHFRAVRILIDGFAGTLDRGIDPEWREAWIHAWPRVYGLSVHRAVQEFDFDVALVYAIMREESTYRETVSSSAGALGLMQILPPTGSRIARELGIDGFDPQSLLTAETNIRFGTYYLKSLMDHFEGSMPLAVASYNAGPEAVSEWIKRDGQRPDDVFIDSVPYSETRRYLRRVLRSYHVYRTLYAENARPPAAIPAQSGDASDR